MLPRLSSRLFGKPLAIRQTELDLVLSAVGSRFGLENLPLQAQDPGPPSRSLTVSGDGIAVLAVTGPLVHRATGIDALCGMTSYQALAAQLQAAAKDPHVRGILLDVDSGGGEVSGCFDLADEIRVVAAAKPVYAVANESAFSAAFALAAAADRVYVPRTAGVGSVGVVALHVDQSKRDARDGYAYSYVHAGARKVEGNRHAPLSREVRARLQAEVNKVRGLFVRQVARDRGLSTAQVAGTEAGVFFGAEAVAQGFADEVGTLSQALADLKRARPGQRRAGRPLAAKTSPRRLTVAAVAENRRRAEEAAELQELAAAVKEDNAKRRLADAERRVLEARGYSVTMSADGTKVESAQPPSYS